ncbi:MAG: flagellar M-ring protein FliF C-terminal domain-containing protein, partial [Planctomycetota bacterium]
MKALLQKLLLQLREAGPGAHFAIASAALVLAGLAGFSFYRSSQPHFSVLFSDLDANEAARMTSALAGEGIRFQLSQPPGPHVLYVDDARFFEAHNAVALAGASSKAPKGIQTGAGGASSVFEGQNERVQKSLKRDWEEMEKQLEALEFVVDANVTSSMPDRSAFRRDKARTVAVTLQIAGGGGLSSAQAQTVAKLVRYRFDVPAENVVIADQNGFSLYDGEEAGRLSSSTDPFEQRARFENDLQDKANSILDQVLGPGRARVTVNSEWQWDQSESIQQIIDKDGAAVVAKEESKKESTGAANNSVGGVVGTSANLLDEFGSPGDGVTPIASAPDPPKTKSSESKVESLVGRETRHHVSTAPT